ncbi:hypothetical protein BT96DRAFT_256361 [Gymnopus androsaceus JB14]|uniref:Uncharacterized protein n=1 Tax=Gymnopus androsaceus JB14 TaxID=1447944 RepID=A0A6A4H724_9AGAR|nr:hypothetical protein BT96DRAFT_256361 [Gymnopus androsaceus JB14]
MKEETTILLGLPKLRSCLSGGRQWMPYHYAAVFDHLKYKGYDPFGTEYAEAQCLPLFTLSAEGDFEIIDQPCSSEQDYHESEQWEVVSEDSEVREPRQSDVPLRHNHVEECTVLKNGCSTPVPRRYKRYYDGLSRYLRLTEAIQSRNLSSIGGNKRLVKVLRKE